MSFSFEKPSSAPKQESLPDFIKKGEKLLKDFRPFFQTFAQDVSLEFSLEEAYYINFESGKVALDARWFAEKECSSDQIIWAVLHELSHFVDFSRDKKAFSANTAENKKQAKRLADWVLAKQPELDAHMIENVAMKAYHTFFNVFDDIYVNNLVVERAPGYAADKKNGQEVERLYRTKLFPGKTYGELPKHLQFLYKLLREEMVPNEGTQVDDDVIDALTKTYKVGKREWNALEFIDDFLKPQSKNDTTMGKRYAKLRTTFLPLFENLLKKDLEAWIKEGSSQQKPRSNPFADAYADFDAASPDQVSDQDFEGWISGGVPSGDQQGEPTPAESEEQSTRASRRRRRRRIAPASQVPPQTQDVPPMPTKLPRPYDPEQQTRDQAFCDRFGIDHYDFEDYKRVEAEVEPYLDQLAQLWRQIAFGKSTGTDLAQAGFYQTGNTLNVGEAVLQWPEIAKQSQNMPRVMERLTEQQLEIKRPESVNVHLLIDVSDSMFEGNKMDVAQQCYVLLTQSLREFSRYLELAGGGRSRLRVRTDARSFSDEVTTIKTPSEPSLDREQADIISSFKRIPSPNGSTFDHLALGEVRRSLTPDDERRIQEGKQMELVFELTDGISSYPQSSIKEIEALINKGVVVRTLQIGRTTIEGQRRFNEVWNREGRQLGFAVGEHVENALPALAQSLAEFLKNVRV